jgi:hypothetical protein
VTATRPGTARLARGAFAAAAARPVRSVAIAVLALALVAAGCGSSSASPSTGASSGTGLSGTVAPGSPTVVVSPSVGSASDPSFDPVVAYGRPATKDPAFTYQPDVVFVGGGAAIVRSVSADGFTWTIDGSAPGAADLKVGSVLLATSRLAGRVAAISDDGGNRTVTLAPALITDIIRDGHIHVDQPLALDGLTYQELPAFESTAISPLASPGPSGAPGASSSPDPSASSGADVSAPAADAALAVARTTVTLPTVRLDAQPSATPPPYTKQCTEVGLNGWNFAPCYQAGKLTLQFTRAAGPGLKFGGTFTLRTLHLSTQMDLSITEGQSSGATMVLNGVDGMDVSLQAGIANQVDNTGFRFEVPIDTYVPLEAVTGLPLVAFFEFKGSVDTALSGKNSTLTASGSYDLSGPIGLQNGTAVAPTLTVAQSLIESISGVTVGASAVTVAVRVKALLGVGGPGMAAGPFMSFTASVGIARGSILGSPIADCRTGSLNLWVGGGTGIEVDLSRVAEFAPKLLGPWLSKLSFSLEKEHNTNVLSRTQTLPNSGACQ